MTLDSEAWRSTSPGRTAPMRGAGSIRGWRPPRWLLLAPAGLFIGLLLACGLAMLRLSFGTKSGEWTEWTLANYEAFNQRYYLASLLTTIRLAVESAVLTVLLAFPVALCMTRTRSALLRRLILIGVLVPMLMSLLVQSYGWIVLLGPGGLVNRMLIGGGLVAAPVPFLFNEAGVLLGLVQTTIPLAVLPIASALRNIPFALEEAAGVLGAPRWRVYLHVILPLCAPALLASALLVFGFNTGAFVVPLLLGGLRVTTLALLIQNQMGTLLNWPMGAAASVVLIVIALAVQAACMLWAPRPPAHRD